MAADLEAEIERNPDDPAGYAVYGDYLATQGDPRGELIALQEAVRRAPGDKRLEKALATHLDDHRVALLGPLADLTKDAVGYVWQYGFLRDVRLTLDAEDLGKVLDALLAHRAGRFLQSLTIAGGHGVVPRDIVRRLLETRRPPTLAELRIGAWDPSSEPDGGEALRAVFPRLQRSIDVVWRAVVEALGKFKRLEVKLDAATLPPLVTLPDAARPPLDTAQLLRGLRVQLERQDIGTAQAMRRTFTADSLDVFAAAVGAQFIELGEPTALRWAFQALGKLGGDRTAELIATHIHSWSHQRAVQAMTVLGEIGSGRALWELYSISINGHQQRPRRTEAAGVLREVAKRQNVAQDRLLDRTLPLGLADRFRPTVSGRLELHMIEGRRIGDRDFARYFAEHPVAAPVVERIVWACYETGSVECTFRVTRGKAVDAAGEPIDLAGATIGVLHPAELPATDRGEVLGAWRKTFAAALLEQPFAQLDRPVLTLRDQEAGDELHRFKLRTVGFHRLRDVLEHERDWHVSDRFDQGGTAAWARHYARASLDVEAQLGGAGGTIERVTLRRASQPVDVATLDPVTISEVLYDLDTATTQNRAAAPSIDAAPGLVGTVTKGARVSMLHDRKGTVFWIGDRGDGTRVGVRGDDGQTTWANIDEVLVIDEPAPAAATSKPAPVAAPVSDFTKGMRVAWKKGRHQGIGTVFWTGANKFGDGTRVGVKDDETGETVWADGADCKPAE